MTMLSIQDAKSIQITESTLASPVKFPEVNVNIASEQCRSDFLADQLGGRAAVVFEHGLYAVAQFLCDEYVGDYWEFAELEGGKVFFCYPRSDKFYTCANNFNLSSGVMDNKTFGMICTIITLGNIFGQVVPSDACLIADKLDNAKDWVFDTLYEQVYNSGDSCKIFEYRKFSREIYKFID